MLAGLTSTLIYIPSCWPASTTTSLYRTLLLASPDLHQPLQTQCPNYGLIKKAMVNFNYFLAIFVLFWYFFQAIVTFS